MPCPPSSMRCGLFDSTSSAEKRRTSPVKQGSNRKRPDCEDRTLLNSLPCLSAWVFTHLLIVGLAHGLAIAQDSEKTKPFRIDRPLAAKIGFEGVGLDLTLAEFLDVEATSFVIYNAAKAKVLLIQKNATPFVGIGIGSQSAGPGGGTEKSWTVVCAGWQHDYERLSFQFLVQLVVQKSPDYARAPFPVSVELGWRI